MRAKSDLPVVAATCALLATACADPVVPTSSMSVGDALGGADTGFARAVAPPDLRFPRDHGAHPEFRTEWWYVTGNLDAADGKRFGVQLVFFRQALAANVPARPANAAARDVILAHAALTDVDGDRHFAEERTGRLAGGMAELRGPDEGGFRAVCADWSAVAVAEGDGFLPLDLRAGGRGFAFDLRVGPGKPPVLQGDRGLSRKGDEPGNASIYYSMTRVPIEGTVRVSGAPLAVRGLAWIDREWSTSALGRDQVGWDWFSLQLDDGTDLMLYQLRKRDGSIDANSRGAIVGADGRIEVLPPGALVATPSGEWTARDGGARYPARWRLTSTSPPLDLEVTPLRADQELRVLVRYWEGAVAVRGNLGGAAVAGRGYLEMTGYTTAR
ncbi:MAG: carotenoid 1,2-hydratase [Planctomycetes bacterium]|nr:carotenoid 1,2-hydratase [Planctomycetota bacterium]